MVRVTVRCAAVVLLCLGLAGCGTGPSPEPSPTASGFADEAEAFAAAEETYRAYVDASNTVDLRNPKTFEAIFKLTTGELNASDRKAFSEFHAEGYTVRGQTVTTKFQPTSYEPDSSPVVRATACSDVSSIDLLDASGTSIVSPDRPDVYQLAIEFVPDADAPHGLLISSSTAVEPTECSA